MRRGVLGGVSARRRSRVLYIAEAAERATLTLDRAAFIIGEYPRSWSLSKKTFACRNSGSQVGVHRSSDTPRFRPSVSVCVRTMRRRGEAGFRLLRFAFRHVSVRSGGLRLRLIHPTRYHSWWGESLIAEAMVSLREGALGSADHLPRGYYHVSMLSGR